MNKKEDLVTKSDANVEEVDPTLLLVKGGLSREEGKNYIKKLAKAILKVHEKHSTVNLRCVGAAALNNAEKAFIIARSEADEFGKELVSKSRFVTLHVGGVEKTGIVKEIFKR